MIDLLRSIGRLFFPPDPLRDVKKSANVTAKAQGEADERWLKFDKAVINSFDNTEDADRYRAFCRLDNL